MIADEGRCYPDYVRREINEHRRERAELYHGHRRGYLLRVPFVDVRPPAGEHQVRGRADRDEFSKPLNYPENDCLQIIHSEVRK